MDPNPLAILLSFLLSSSGPAPLEDLEPFLGRWRSSEDDRVRQIDSGLDARVVNLETREHGEVIVQGAFYWNPLKQQIEGRFVRSRSALRFDAAVARLHDAELRIDRVGVNAVGERLVLRESWRIEADRLITEARWLNRSIDAPAWTETWRRVPPAVDASRAR